jgi:hypothetical protein
VLGESAELFEARTAALVHAAATVPAVRRRDYVVAY